MGMTYEYHQWDQEDRNERNRYWMAIREMRKEYSEQYKGIYDLTVRPTIHYWAEEKYGFRMEISGSGDYTENYTVIDPKKFMLFQIKYWK